MSRVVLYGATGYTGRLAARTLAGRGIDPALAGRDAQALAAVAEPLGLPVRGDPGDLDGVTVLVNCAPAAATQAPLVEACLRAGVHYLDIAGEVPEHVALQAHDAAARQAGVMLLPGAGFGVVPTDCLAAHVAARLPEATRLEIAFKTVGGVSRGTAATLLGGLHTQGWMRSGGQLVERSAGARTLHVDLADGDGTATLATHPWRADVVSAGRSTGVPEIETFAALPLPLRAGMRVAPHLAPLLTAPPVRLAARTLGRLLPEGPSESDLDAGRTTCWARATDAAGRSRSAVLHGPEAYVFTALAIELCVRRVLAGDAPAGLQTPATAFGADAVLAIEGVVRRDR